MPNLSHLNEKNEKLGAKNHREQLNLLVWGFFLVKKKSPHRQIVHNYPLTPRFAVRFHLIQTHYYLYTQTNSASLFLKIVLKSRPFLNQTDRKKSFLYSKIPSSKLCPDKVCLTV